MLGKDRWAWLGALASPEVPEGKGGSCAESPGPGDKSGLKECHCQRPCSREESQGL